MTFYLNAGHVYFKKESLYNIYIFLIKILPYSGRQLEGKQDRLMQS